MTLEELELVREQKRPMPLSDPVFARMKFPFTRTFYPLGFPVEIATNCEKVLHAAAESWDNFAELFPTQRVVIQVGVLEANSTDEPPAPVCRVQKHLFTFTADADNFGVADLDRGFSSVWLMQNAVQRRSYLRHYFLDCAALTQISTRYATGVHAGCVSHNGAGVLLCGDSGAGKSTLTYACAKAGWTYITDDGSYLVHGRNDLLVAGDCHRMRFRPETASIFPEIAGKPITHRADTGKPSLELSTDTLPGVHRSPYGVVQHLVFLNRRGGRNEGLRSYPRDTARAYLSQARFAPEAQLQRHEEMIEKLLGVEVMELRYRDLPYALAQLESLVEFRHP